MKRRLARSAAALAACASLFAFFLAEGRAPADLAPPWPPPPPAPSARAAARPASAAPVATPVVSASAAPSVAGSAATSASAAPAGAPVSSAAVAASGKSFQEEPPLPEKNPMPSTEAWREALPIALDRGVAACRAYRVREWLKIHCDGFPAAGVSLLAGDPEGVLTWVDPVTEGTSQEAMKKPRGAEVIFPVRRGDGRVVQFAQFGEGYDGPLGWNVGFTVSEQWLPEEPAPVITVW